MKNTSNNCSCIAFYSAEKHVIDYEKLYLLFLTIASELGCVITHAGVVGEAYSNKVAPIKKMNKQLELKNYQNIDSMSIYSQIDEGKNYDNWQFYASVMSSPASHGCELVLCIDKRFNLFESDLIINLINLIKKLFWIDYGIGYKRSYELGPIYYASGVIQGIERNSVEANKISSWFKAMLITSDFNFNLLRDVYEFNFLSRRQLDAKISYNNSMNFNSTLNLEQWIIKNKFGLLSQIDSNLWLWQIENNIEYIAELLSKNNLLI